MKETGERLAYRRGQSYDRQREDQREQDERDDLAVRRRGDRIGWDQRGKPPGERLSLRAGQLARRFGGAGGERRPRPQRAWQRQQGEQRGGERNDDGSRRGEQQEEDDERPPSKP